MSASWLSFLFIYSGLNLCPLLSATA